MTDCGITPGKKAAARKMFNDAVRPMASIAAYLGVSDSEFRKLRQKWQWPQRPVRRPRALSQAGEAKAVEAGLASVDLAQLEQDLATAVTEFLPDVTSRLSAALKSPHNLADIDQLTKNYVAIGKTISQLKALKEGTDGDRQASPGDAPPRSMEELRDELARRIQNLVGAGAAE